MLRVNPPPSTVFSENLQHSTRSSSSINNLQIDNDSNHMLNKDFSNIKTTTSLSIFCPRKVLGRISETKPIQVTKSNTVEPENATFFNFLPKKESYHNSPQPSTSICTKEDHSNQTNHDR